VKRRAWVLLAVALGVGAVLAPVSGAVAGAQSTPASDIGITASTIRIGVIADVDNAARPGLFQGDVNGVKAFAKYINGQGGLAGRKVQVDFLDSHLSPDDARDALIQACENDFAIVGTSALFLSNVQPMIDCQDKAGAATGLPDVPILQTEVAHQCSPVSFPIIAGALDCSTKDQAPQTYTARNGQIHYYKTKSKDLHGDFLIPKDLKSTINATLPVIAGIEAGGVENNDQFEISGLATQSEYTPLAQSLKSNNATYFYNGSDYKADVSARREAKIQGVTTVKFWDCSLACYDQRMFSEGGADVEGQYVNIFFVPLFEASQNKSVAAYVKNVGGVKKADGFGAQAWTAGLFFRDVVNNIVKADGNDGITRARFIEEARKIHDFTAAVGGDGMIGKTDVGDHKVNGCFMTMQIKSGKFVRVFPTKKGTLNCDAKNTVQVKLDLDL
jgi:ABC-type branched-subunit amino acid transport system substrate-binding protein